MKFSIALAGFLLALSGVCHAAAPLPAAPLPLSRLPAPAPTPEQTGRKAIQAILRNAPLDSVRPYFEKSLQEDLTPETLEGFRSQIAWLSQLLGDSLDILMTGTQFMDSGRTLFFREYRLANESNKRAPLVVTHLMFADSTSPVIEGAFNKSFADDTKNQVAGEQTWSIGGRDVLIHSVSYMEFDQGLLPVVRFYDEDTTAMDSALAVNKGVPLVKEAIARGYLEKIKGELQGRALLPSFGVAFIRREPHLGYMQYKFGLRPEDYDPAAAAAAKKKAAARKAGAKGKPGAKKAAAQKPAVKK